MSDVIFIFGASIALIALVIGCMTLQGGVHFKKSLPPISDEQFLARCGPGTRPEVALKVRRIVAKHFAVEYERIHPSMSFIDDIGAD